MSDNIVGLRVKTKLPLPVDRILTSEAAMALSEVVVIGWKDDGSLHLAMSDPSLDRALMLLACAQRKIVEDVVS